jgi:hypothetical protein
MGALYNAAGLPRVPSLGKEERRSVEEEASGTVAAALMALMILVVGAMPAFAAASPQASCLGIGGSTETSLEGPGGRADISHEVKGDAEEQGTTPGAIYSGFAKQHLRSGDACFG